MGWLPGTLDWLTHTALGSSLFLAAGCLAVLFCRQPVRRVRLIELTLLGCLLVPVVVLLPGLPRWSAGWFDFATSAPTTTTTALSDGSVTLSEPSFPRTTPSEPPPRPVTPAVGETPKEAAAVTPVPASAPPEVSYSPVQNASEGDGGSLAGTSGSGAVFAYAATTGVFLIWALFGVVQLVRLWATASPAPAAVTRLFREVAGPGADRVRLLVSDRTELPLTFAARRPFVVLPASLCRGGDSLALRFCLAHEWSHVENGDSWRWYLATLGQVLFFYQPLFWWLRGQLRLSQDFLADARAAQQAAEAEDYAEYLVSLARRRAGIPAAALGIGGRRSSLSRRIIMLLLPRQPLERRCLKPWSAAALVGAIALLVACTALRLDAGDQKDQPEKPAPKDDKDKPAEPAKALNYTGKVTEKGTGKPIAGATVTVRRSLYGDPEVKVEDQLVEETKHQTDKDGKYSFTIPPEQVAKRYLYIELDVEHDNYAPQKRFGYALSMILKNEKLGGRPFFESVELRKGEAISGTVRTPEGKPAAGVKVMAYSKSGGEGDRFEYGSFADTKTDAEGKFRLVVTTPGPAVFWLLPKDYALSFHSVKEGKRGDLGAFTLGNGVTFTGKVLDAKGKPLAGVNVNAETMEPNEELAGLIVADAIRRSAVTDDKGEFTMAPLPPGAYRVKPDKRSSDSSKEDRKKYALPDVFINTKVVLKDGAKTEPVELRAVPSVVLEMQYLDSKGKPTRGHECHVFGQIDNDFWFGDGPADANGKIVARIPHGMEQVRVSLMTNEHGVLRHRLSGKDPLSNKRELELGTVTEDIKGVEIIRYVAPILVVNAKDKDGKQIKDFKVRMDYEKADSKKDPNSQFINGVQGDVYMEKQEDGRWRSQGFFPDEDLTVAVTAEGFETKSMKLKLSEGEMKDLDFVLEKK